MKILIVEDEQIAAHFLKTVLEKAGWEVAGIAADAARALEIAKTARPGAVLMDVMLKGPQSGCECALQIRAALKECAIVFLTAHAEEEMLAYAVDVKAEGYLLKPYNEREIVATLRLIEARRQNPAPAQVEPAMALAGGFVYDRQTRRLLAGGREIRLTAQMVTLFELLARVPGAALSTERLCVELWGDAEASGRLRTLVFRVRRRAGHDLVESFKGLGYRLSLAQ